MPFTEILAPNSTNGGRNIVQFIEPRSERRITVLKEFREFAMKGNMIDLAVGVVIGGAFGLIVTSLVNDVIMPLVGLLLGKVDFAQKFMILSEGDPTGPYKTVEEATKAGAVALRYGAFINAVVNFLIVAFVIFMVIKAMNRMRRAPAPAVEAAPEPNEEVKLLTEIRDSLKAK